MINYPSDILCGYNIEKYTQTKERHNISVHIMNILNIKADRMLYSHGWYNELIYVDEIVTIFTYKFA